MRMLRKDDRPHRDRGVRSNHMADDRGAARAPRHLGRDAKGRRAKRAWSVKLAGDVLFDLFVPGVPSPAGSKRAIPVWNRKAGGFAHAANGRPIVAVTDASKGSRAWKDRISALAVEKWRSTPLEEPLCLWVSFTMPRPKSHFGSRGGKAHLKESAPRYHTGAPDTTKLVRAVEDALNGIVWKDDRYVVEQRASKEYGDTPGVSITVALAGIGVLS